MEDHHHPGNGCYEVIVIPTEDISPVLPYLNAVLKDTNYDHVNKILIGSSDHQRYAFRPHEIRAGVVTDKTEATGMADDAVALINRIWDERERITPSTKERKIPTAFDLYKALPRKNCKQCGYPTCLVFAAKLHDAEVEIEQCTLLEQPEYIDARKKINDLFSDCR